MTNRRTESARSLLVGLIKQVEASSKKMMFRYIQQVKQHFFDNKKGKKWTKWPISLSQGVAERGVSVVATKNIIDAVKVNFESSSKTLSGSVYNSICSRAFGFQRLEIWKKQKQTLRSLSMMSTKNVCHQFTVLKHNKTCPRTYLVFVSFGSPSHYLGLYKVPQKVRKFAAK